MSHQELTDALEQYRAGLETAVSLLHQLQDVSARQRAVTEARDFVRMAAESDQRDHLTRAMVAIEPGLRTIRESLAASNEDLHVFPVYEQVLELRHRAADLVAEILKTDEASMRALADAELARRAAMAGIATGETTLAAYRRVLNPPVGAASVLNLRG